MTNRPTWRPASDPERARLRAAMLDRAREYFRLQCVLEVDTPALSRSAVSDPHIESIEASLQLTPSTAHFLHTSPEYCMKRLLCSGYPDIYQVCKVFRDNEVGRFHQPEFTMIEWYRLGFDLDQITNDTLVFIACVFDDSSLASNAEHVEFADVLQEFAGCDPFAADNAELATLVGADERLSASLGDDSDAWLDLLFERKVVPHFAADRLTAVSHYPLSQAALARRCPANEAVADRFEVFLGQHELANGYVELAEADEHVRRFEADQVQRKSRGQNERPLDNDFLAAVRHGLPACAGVAVGFDRLLMIHAGANDIRDVQTFAFPERNR